MCEDHLINPLNDEKNRKKRQARVDVDWDAYNALMTHSVLPFHMGIAGKYHPKTHAFIGSSDTHKAYGNVTWVGNGGSWLRGDREADVLNARALDPTQVSRKRTVEAPLDGDGWLKVEYQTYKISNPDEAGDGTVPRRSGVAPKSYCKSFAQVVVEHEPAFKPRKSSENLRACQFTLRAIVKIAQDVQQTSLRYG